MTLPTLTLSDQCDRCPAPALVAVELSTGGRLDFCAHHYKRHAAKLQAVEVRDQRDTLPAEAFR